ncbi:DUF2059 domain-containing protein [Alkalimarinus alittae]|uniref:DUF2059 domain-containing protein n=1 Tax=Alkalimarinus alittae TaxID=2961619 RepID=A0ABY6N124_9ALTE|nr:DUF2059 domain-containing protein [Alkalimarinus alittae]UZE95704.1 DUF2059 domain-containing protein [Alkalimarinus alittae]
MVDSELRILDDLRLSGDSGVQVKKQSNLGMQNISIMKNGGSAMMHHIKIFIFMIFTAQSFFLHAESNEGLANKIINRSGLSEMINQFPALLKEGVKQGAQQSGANNQKMVMQISQIIDHAFGVNESIAVIRKDLSEQLTEQELQTVLEWLDSPLGKKITEMEVGAMSSESFQDMQLQIMDLQKKYRGSEREKLFERFNKSTNATEASLETAIAVQLTLASAMSASSTSPQMPSYEYLKKSIEDNRFMMRGVIGQQVYSNYLYTYQALTDQELKAYVDFTGSPAGNRYSLVVNESIKNVLLKPSEVIGTKMARDISG